MNIGVNFFGPKKKLYEDFDGTLNKLKKAGITSAELCISFTGSLEPPKGLDIEFSPEDLAEVSGGIWVYKDADEKIKKVRNAGLSVISAHMFGDNSSPEAMLDILPLVKEFGVKHQIRCFVISLMKDLEGMKLFAPAMKQITETLNEAGIMMAYHNHEMEFDSKDGQTALDYILSACPLLKLELDVGWAKFAGADPLAIMKQYRDRIVLLHFKDITSDACPANRETCFTAVGEGSIPLKAIMAESKNCPIMDNGMIIDQDDSLTDIIDDLAVGARNIRENA